MTSPPPPRRPPAPSVPAMPPLRLALLVTMVALLLCGWGEWGAAADEEKADQLRRRLVDRLASRGLPLREQHSRAEELLARLLPDSVRPDNPWFPPNLSTTTLGYGSAGLRSLDSELSTRRKPSSDLDRTRDDSPGTLNTRTNELRFPQDQFSRTAEDLSEVHPRTIRQNTYHNHNLYQRQQAQRPPTRERSRYQQPYRQESYRRERIAPSTDRDRPLSNRRDYSNSQRSRQTMRASTENPSRDTTRLQTHGTNSRGIPAMPNMDDLISQNIEEIVRSRINSTSLQVSSGRNRPPLESPISEDVRELIRESSSLDTAGRSDIVDSRLEESIPNQAPSEGELTVSVDTTTTRTETREERRIALREKRRQREERRKNSKRDRNRRNRNRNRKKDRNKKNKNRGRKKRNKIEELIANESLILHEVDGQPFLDCCPSKLVVVEKQVGKARDKHAVELHPDSQFFYERVCMEEFEGSECIFPARALKPWVQTRCAQTYSFSQALVRPYDSTDEWALDYIEVSSGCSCQVNVSPRGGNSSSSNSSSSSRRRNTADTNDEEGTDVSNNR